jgi:hypothetical protein
MVKTHPYSRFTIKSMEEIRDSRDITLQAEKTDSTFSRSGKAVYMCEVVDANLYNKSTTTERLTDEIVRVNAENRRLLQKLVRAERDLRKMIDREAQRNGQI